MFANTFVEEDMTLSFSDLVIRFTISAVTDFAVLTSAVANAGITASWT